MEFVGPFEEIVYWSWDIDIHSSFKKETRRRKFNGVKSHNRDAQFTIRCVVGSSVLLKPHVFEINFKKFEARKVDIISLASIFRQNWLIGYIRNCVAQSDVDFCYTLYSEHNICGSLLRWYFKILFYTISFAKLLLVVTPSCLPTCNNLKTTLKECATQ